MEGIYLNVIVGVAGYIIGWAAGPHLWKLMTGWTKKL